MTFFFTEFTPSQRSGLRKRRRAQSPVNKQPESLEEWIEEEKLELWEIKYFGERIERAASVIKKGINNSENNKNENVQTLSRSASPAEIKARMEEQLKIQRANFAHKKALEGSPQVAAKGGVVKLSLGSGIGTNQGKISISSSTGSKIGSPSSNVVSVGPQLPLVGGKKIVTTRDGRIISVQTSIPPQVNNQQNNESGGSKSGINMGSSTIFPVGGVPKVQVTSQGNKVIRLQPMGGGQMQRMILPRSSSSSSTNVVHVTPRSTRPQLVPVQSPSVSNPSANVQTTPNQLASNVNTPTSGKTNQQQIQIIRMNDGQLQVRGLLEGQQLFQRPDGKFQLLSTKSATQSPASQSVNAAQTSNTPTSSSSIQVTQQTNALSGDNVIKTPSTPAQIVKVNGQQVLLRPPQENKQVVTVGASEAVASMGSVKQATAVPGPTSPRIKTMVASDGTMVKTVVPPNMNNAKVPKVPNALANLPQSNTSGNTTNVPQTSPNSTASNVAMSSGNSLKLRVQVRMTEQGPKTIIQGLQPGVGLTKDHIIAIQQQVRSMLQQCK